MNNNDAFLPLGLISPTSSSLWIVALFFHFLFLRFSTTFSLFFFLETLCSHHALWFRDVLLNPLLSPTSKRSLLNSICAILAVDWAGQCPGLFYLPAAHFYRLDGEVQVGVCALPAVDAPLIFIKDAPGTQTPVVFPRWQKVLAKRLFDIKGSYPPEIKYEFETWMFSASWADIPSAMGHLLPLRFERFEEIFTPCVSAVVSVSWWLSRSV